MYEFVVRPLDVLRIVARRRNTMVLTFCITFAIVMVGYVVAPRSYQSEAVIVIGVSYFQNPLIGDLVSQTHDPGELRTEREKIIKASVGVDFAKKMAEKYKIFNSGPDDPNWSAEIEKFLKDLEISSVGGAEFQIRYKANRPEIADGIVNSALDSIREHMYASRIQMLEQFSGVLGEEIVNTGSSTPPKSAGGDAAVRVNPKSDIASQLEALNKRLDQLHRSYNEEHPAIQAVKSQIEELQAVQNSGGLSNNLTHKKIFRSGAPESAGQIAIQDDLSKQKHLVNISLEMERKDPKMAAYLTLTKEPVYPKKPVFPKLRLFLLLALVSGVLFSTIAAAFVEFWTRSRINAMTFSQQLQIEHLGVLYLTKENRN